MNKRIFIPILFIFNFAFQKEFVKLDVKNKNMRKLDEELSDDIVILHVNDVHCGLNDTVGYDGFVLYRDEMKKKYKNVILVDVGDHIQGGSIGAISSGEAIIKLMNNIEFNVSILGNHEFDYGIEQLQKLGENITNKYVCSNFCYNKNKSRILEPYKIIDTGKKKLVLLAF
jgi:2',3'-cyclic-nucleotide 2'-phosphodiesterase (5'-nucleotidase family)